MFESFLASQIASSGDLIVPDPKAHLPEERCETRTAPDSPPNAASQRSLIDKCALVLDKTAVATRPSEVHDPTRGSTRHGFED